MPFKPATWIQKTTAPMSVIGCTVMPDGALLAQGTAVFTGGNPGWFVNTCAVTRNQAFSWGTMSNENDEHYSSFFSIQNPDDTRYFRIRTKFGRSFFVANSTIFSGYMKIDQSLDGLNWNEVKTLHTWPHLVDTVGAGGQAQIVFGAIPIFLPGTGPGGADADWLLVRCRVFSAQGTPVDKFEWYRSDDFGFTWDFVRNETAVQFSGVTPNFLVRSTNGRIAAGMVGLWYSDDNGVTWHDAGGALPPQIKSGVTKHAGSTLCLYMAGGLGSTSSTGVSCDAGVTWGVSHGPDLGGASTNPNALSMGVVEALAFCGNGVNGGNVWYTNNGGENWLLQGVDTRLPSGQACVTGTGFFPNGAPVIIGANGVVLVSNDRPSGAFAARDLCPLANAGLAKANIPNLCGHAILQNRC